MPSKRTRVRGGGGARSVRRSRVPHPSPHVVKPVAFHPQAKPDKSVYMEFFECDSRPRTRAFEVRVALAVHTEARHARLCNGRFPALPPSAWNQLEQPIRVRPSLPQQPA